MKTRIIQGRTKRRLGGCKHVWSVRNSRTMPHRHCKRCGIDVYYPSGTDISIYENVANPKNRIIQGRSKRLPKPEIEPATEPGFVAPAILPAPEHMPNPCAEIILGVDIGREPSFTNINIITQSQVADADFAALEARITEQIYHSFMIPREYLISRRLSSTHMDRPVDIRENSQAGRSRASCATCLHGQSRDRTDQRQCTRSSNAGELVHQDHQCSYWLSRLLHDTQNS